MAKNSKYFRNAVGVRISLINLWHFGLNFGTRNARKSIKPFKDLYYSLVSNKNSSQKNGSWRWRHGPNDVVGI